MQESPTLHGRLDKLECFITIYDVFVFQPPPPGVMPNAAQMAQAQGSNVVVTQQKSGWLEGSGSGGGYVWW